MTSVQQSQQEPVVSGEAAENEFPAAYARDKLSLTREQEDLRRPSISLCSAIWIFEKRSISVKRTLANTRRRRKTTLLKQRQQRR